MRRLDYYITIRLFLDSLHLLINTVQVRKLARYINASPQRRESFRRYQQIDRADHEPLGLLLDCRTRWNSTYLMLFRAHKLREPIRRYISATDDESLFPLSLGYGEWRHVEYLLQLLHEFYAFTKSLSIQNGVTIHKASIIYFNRFLPWLHLTDMS